MKMLFDLRQDLCKRIKDEEGEREEGERGRKKKKEGEEGKQRLEYYFSIWVAFTLLIIEPSLVPHRSVSVTKDWLHMNNEFVYKISLIDTKKVFKLQTNCWRMKQLFSKWNLKRNFYWFLVLCDTFLYFICNLPQSLLSNPSINVSTPLMSALWMHYESLWITMNHFIYKHKFPSSFYCKHRIIYHYKRFFQASQNKLQL